MNKCQAITCGIFYCRDSANTKGCGSLQTSSWLDNDVLRSRQQKHTAITLAVIVKKNPKLTTKLDNDTKKLNDSANEKV